MKKIGVIAIVLLAAVVIHDLAVEPRRAIGVTAAVAAIDGYRAVASPRMSRFVTCRFKPTCSVYARAVMLKHGFAIGTAKTVGRIARCGPWTAAGTVDLP